MRRTNTSGMLPSREIACDDADCLIVNGKPEILGRKPWSTGDCDGIIDSIQELNTVRWALSVIEMLLEGKRPTLPST